MTVCVAAIFSGGVFGASDRMLTSGDIEFEPKQSKIAALTTSIAVMWAGDTALQMEVLRDVIGDVQTRVESDPEKWWAVREVAELYQKYCNIARIKRAENVILAPLGLNHKTFLSRQSHMSPDLVQRLATELINFSPPPVEAIIAGADKTGIHLYLASNSEVTCQDAVGFAAIGVGAWHANSQLMFGGHTKTRELAETLLLVYSAKKRAEVAPGVGEATDMFMVEYRLGSFINVGQDVISTVDGFYRDGKAEQDKISEKTEESVRNYVQDLISAGVAKEQSINAEDGSGATSIN